ncbi:hypothetical protein GCM10010435_65870 [Winogradskya consettensis]|uniref:Uncharacterized protein n=1 Tax=Winogradskya consettensis TaxID=113560 RepID=A0A919VZA8_9ACTN|nr:hypothetical protein [Actinoplanes consettensis]GIM84801.1 hypothetical protein Aco04nite_93220 [Actinoplanes consettensis]
MYFSGKGMSIVAQSTVDAYDRECGRGQTDSQQELILDSKYLLDKVKVLENIFGTDLPSILDRHRKATSTRTPPKDPHRLVELLVYVRELSDCLSATDDLVNVDLDLNRLSEFLLASSMFHRWRHHPAISDLTRKIAKGTEVRHSVMLLGLASYIVDEVLPVELKEATALGRSADLVTRPVLHEELLIELKTPTALQSPRVQSLSSGEAQKILKKVLGAATSGSRKQLDAANSGMVAVGAFGITDKDFAVLNQAARDLLRELGSKKESRKPYLAGFLTVNAKAHVEFNETKPSTLRFASALEVNMIPYPGYKGALNVRPGIRTGGGILSPPGR